MSAGDDALDRNPHSATVRLQGLKAMTVAWLKRLHYLTRAVARQADPYNILYQNFPDRFGCYPVPVNQATSLHALLSKTPDFVDRLGQYAAALAGGVVHTRDGSHDGLVSYSEPKRFSLSPKLHEALHLSVRQCLVRNLPLPLSCVACLTLVTVDISC